jgi:hypothetical protein
MHQSNQAHMLWVDLRRHPERLRAGGGIDTVGTGEVGDCQHITFGNGSYEVQRETGIGASQRAPFTTLRFLMGQLHRMATEGRELVFVPLERFKPRLSQSL